MWTLKRNYYGLPWLYISDIIEHFKRVIMKDQQWSIVDGKNNQTLIYNPQVHKVNGMNKMWSVGYSDIQTKYCWKLKCKSKT